MAAGQQGAILPMMEQILEVEDGRSVSLGSDEELQASLRDIMNATGGSSGLGQFSILFGLDAEGPMPGDLADRLSQEAEEFKMMVGAQLRLETVALLDRLVALGSGGSQD